MKQLVKSWWLVGLALLLMACSAEQAETSTTDSLITDSMVAANVDQAAVQPIQEVAATAIAGTPISGAINAAPSVAMRTAHMSQIPEPYNTMTNTISAEFESLERGAETYATYCSVCHGTSGMGDGPASATIDPPVAPVAQSSQMMGDAYFFWRISEGGKGDPLTSAMPAWKASLSTQQIWDVINYVRSLGMGTAPRQAQGGAQFDPAQEQAQIDAMLETAIEMQIITADDAALFTAIHDVLDSQTGNGRGQAQIGGQAVGLGQAQGGGFGQGRGQGGQGRGQMQAERVAGLGRLVMDGVVSREDAIEFERVRGLLLDAGLMQ
jgi:mono/diheme cytochrome c family protein